MPSWEPEVWISLVSLAVAVLALALTGATVVLTGRSVKAAQRANELQEQQLALQRQQFQLERRGDNDEPRQPSEARARGQFEFRGSARGAASPLPLSLIRRGKNTFELRNNSAQTLTDVTVDSEAVPLSRGLPLGETLQPSQGSSFLLLEAWGAPRPPHIWVTWNGQEQPVPLSVPD